MRVMVEEDLSPVVDLLVTALDQDPGWEHGLPVNREEGLRFLLPRLLGVWNQAGGCTWVAERDQGVAAVLTVLPSRARPGIVSYLRNGLIGMPWSIGLDATRRLLEMDRQRSRLRAILTPPTPHLHLIESIGPPDLLLGDWLETVDEPVSTLTSRAEHVRELQDLGFELIGQDGIDKAFTAWMLTRS